VGGGFICHSNRLFIKSCNLTTDFQKKITRSGRKVMRSGK
jgi:hypothetical protein